MLECALTQEQLYGTLARVYAAVDTRSGAMPTLSCVLIRGGNGCLHLTGSNLELELQAWCSADVPEFTALVPGRKLWDIVRTFNEGDIFRLRLEPGRFVLACGRSRFSLSTLPADNFPLFGRLDPESRYRVDPAALRFGLTHCSPCMAEKDVRFYLNGLTLAFEPRALMIQASDGAIAARQRIELLAGDETRAIIVPRRAVGELAKLLADLDDEPLDLHVSSNVLAMNVGTARLACKLIEGRFPGLDKVMPRTFEAELSFDRGALIAAIRRVDVLANREFRGVAFVLKNGWLRFSSRNMDSDEAEDAIEIDSDASLNLGFNAGKFLGLLGHLNTDQVTLGLNQNGASLLSRPNDDSGCYIVMPMRL